MYTKRLKSVCSGKRCIGEAKGMKFILFEAVRAIHYLKGGSARYCADCKQMSKPRLIISSDDHTKLIKSSYQIPKPQTIAKATHKVS
jgi:hypothetical protein